MRRNAVLPVLALLLLAGCATSSTPPAEEPVGETSSPASTEPAPAPPPRSAPDGCSLVTAELVLATLGVDPGPCQPADGWADGPAGSYPAITMNIDTTASAPMYMPVEVCGGAGFEGALPIPGADYGYAVAGDLCVVSGDVGIKVSAPGVATVDDWQRLAVALLPLL